MKVAETKSEIKEMSSDAGGPELAALYTMPGHLIRRCQQYAYALFVEETVGLDVTPVQFAALMAIAAYPGIDATRLSSLIAYDRSTLGDVLERIEGKGWLERRPGRTDRRIKSLWLTAAGLSMFKAAKIAVQRTQHRIVEPIPVEERALLISLLQRLAANEHETLRFGRALEIEGS